jgi:hypothetical protein
LFEQKPHQRTAKTKPETVTERGATQGVEKKKTREKGRRKLSKLHPVCFQAKL